MSRFFTCKAGWARMWQHRAVAATLTNLFGEWTAGGQGDTSTTLVRYDDERARGAAGEEAILDLAVNFLGQLCTYWIDVSARELGKIQRQCKENRSLRRGRGGGENEALQWQSAADGHGFGRFGPESEKAHNHNHHHHTPQPHTTPHRPHPLFLLPGLPLPPPSSHLSRTPRFQITVLRCHFQSCFLAR